MKIIFGLAALIIITSCTHAPRVPSSDVPQFKKTQIDINLENMKIVDLTGIQILEPEQQTDILNHSVGLLDKPSQKVLNLLLEQTGDDLIASRIYFEEPTKGPFKQIYVFITEDASNPENPFFKLNTLSVSQTGNKQLLRFKILKATLGELQTIQGVDNTSYVITKRNDTPGTLFPLGQ